MIRTAQAIAVRIGYVFSDEDLLETALSHRSVGRRNNERLEFLGDSVLNFVVAQSLYGSCPDAREGVLTRMRATVVRQKALAGIARRIGLGQYLVLGGGELKSGGRDRDSILADALEAVIGAILVDGGIEACRDSIGRLFAAELETASSQESLKDPKTRLQEFLQSRRLPLPQYAVVSERGSSHAREFEVSCTVSGVNDPFIGQGESRRVAEQEAAIRALRSIDNG